MSEPGSKKYHLTFDIDWAPDSSVELCLNTLREAGSKATFFVTHPSDILKDVASDGHEIGIHPNFLENSSHGKTPLDIVEYCLNIAPQATSMRTHALVQSTPMLHSIFKTFPQLKLDLSVFTHRFSTVERFGWEFDGVRFDRINYNWEDDAEFWANDFQWDSATLFAEINVLDFHPIHVALNSKDNENYSKLKEALGGTPLFECADDLISRNKNRAPGAQTYLQAILDSKHEEVALQDIK